MSQPLTFNAFRAANVARCTKWHPQGIASWSPSDWLTAVTGELGELASLLKMRNRERDGLPGNKFSPTQKQIADELADVLTYLDLLAEVLGVDLGAAAVSKFNEVSERVGFPDRLPSSPLVGRPSLADVVAERERQIKQEGFDSEHDDSGTIFPFCRAAAAYALSASGCWRGSGVGNQMPLPIYWPWDRSWWKPTTPRRDLVKAAALIIAEIDRLDRIAAKRQR